MIFCGGGDRESACDSGCSWSSRLLTSSISRIRAKSLLIRDYAGSDGGEVTSYAMLARMRLPRPAIGARLPAFSSNISVASKRGLQLCKSVEEVRRVMVFLCAVAMRTMPHEAAVGPQDNGVKSAPPLEAASPAADGDSLPSVDSLPSPASIPYAAVAATASLGALETGYLTQVCRRNRERSVLVDDRQLSLTFYDRPSGQDVWC